jgi:hypothetical protein
MKTELKALISIGLVALASCSQPAITPVPEPPMPEQYSRLPLSAKMRCTGETSTKPEFLIWEFPGIEPGDKNSAYQGNRGNWIAHLKPCESVTILQVVWSEWDRDWYLLVRFSDKRGWARQSVVELTATMTPTPAP